MSRDAIGSNQDAYFLWVTLRLLIEKTNEKPPWDIVAEAMGGGAKQHAMYMRYWTLTKKPPTPSLKKTVPDLEGLIAKAKADGKLAKGPARGGRGGGRKATTKRKVADDADSDEEDVKPKRKAKATPVSRKPRTIAPKPAVEESDNDVASDQDAEGETDVDECAI